jgi:glycosyltransferase involved in cell wall biosynthesis
MNGHRQAGALREAAAQPSEGSAARETVPSVTAIPGPRISVICPFYNEAAILDVAVRRLLVELETIPWPTDVVLVNDGSTDGSGVVADCLAREFPFVRLTSYAPNRGRGHALRAGLQAAQGDILITLECDLSWGPDIVRRLVKAMERFPNAQLIVASPHLPGGGFRGVPAPRRWLSRAANLVIRSFVPGAPTMSTGMTRAYRAEAVRGLFLQEDRKTFHLEVILKALLAGWTIREIPAVLAWDPEDLGGTRGHRTGYMALLRAGIAHFALLLRERPRRGRRVSVPDRSAVSHLK